MFLAEDSMCKPGLFPRGLKEASVAGGEDGHPQEQGWDMAAGGPHKGPGLKSVVGAWLAWLSG